MRYKNMLLMIRSTLDLCLWINQMFDPLNRHASRGVLPNNNDFKVTTFINLLAIDN